MPADDLWDAVVRPKTAAADPYFSMTWVELGEALNGLLQEMGRRRTITVTPDRMALVREAVSRISEHGASWVQ